ncbi:2-phospho-L-lactate transferase [Tersicoccus phoenicis]|uniref:Putative gluconeogenesis factor n=1 Tax=Tersicoccus phoenicis TaxID=554083 RepID=A0A1R1LFR6_9MICC|nr:uridine diphosphate-N-acetylglucosamine-binding protein YvcK [Tersicoccus phoenicis]OMH26345.1 2-phospho-L-lactate transferase [Tersicoccus phoenicis]
MPGFPTGALPVVPGGGSRGPAGREPAVVALGGGHGLYASLSALRLLTSELTAVVTVADDGGSSGKVRQELDVLPPGDLRMALAALCDDTDWGRTWRDVMQHRFRSRPGSDATLDNHALGNLLIVALWELLENPVDGLRWAGALLGARGQVLPMASVPLTIEGDVRRPDGGVDVVRGQSRLALAGTLDAVRLDPPEAPACREALEAIELADWVILGPGSWYTSVLPHLLLPELRDALCATTARRLVTMNLGTATKETRGMSAAEHLAVLHHCAPDFRVDAVLADPASVDDPDGLRAAAAGLGAEVIFGRVGASGGAPVHDHVRLATAYHDIFGGS